MKNFLLPLLLIGCALSGAITTQAQSNYEPYSFTTFAGIAQAVAPAPMAPAAPRASMIRVGVAVDSAGNVYVADGATTRSSKMTPSGVVSALAGRAGSLGSDDG